MLQKYRQIIKKWEKWHQDPHDEHGQIAANPLDEYRKGLCNADERRLAKEIKKHDRWKARDLQKMTALQLTRLARRANRFDSPNLAAAAVMELAGRIKPLRASAPVHPPETVGANITDARANATVNDPTN